MLSSILCCSFLLGFVIGNGDDYPLELYKSITPRQSLLGVVFFDNLIQQQQQEEITSDSCTLELNIDRDSLPYDEFSIEYRFMYAVGGDEMIIFSIFPERSGLWYGVASYSPTGPHPFPVRGLTRLNPCKDYYCSIGIETKANNLSIIWEQTGIIYTKISNHSVVASALNSIGLFSTNHHNNAIVTSSSSHFYNDYLDVEFKFKNYSMGQTLNIESKNIYRNYTF